MIQTNHPDRQNRLRDVLTSYFWSGEAIRSRRVSDVLLTATLDVPVPNPRLLADWERETSSRMDLEPGDVEEMPLARARSRWPEYARCVEAVSDWTKALGLPGVLTTCDVALMACRGARYHHDGEQYGSAAFCNLFLSEDKGLDLHFASMDHRVPLKRGTVVIFDTCQPHGVIRRGGSGFRATDFTREQDCTQIFLTWELPIEQAPIAHALGVVFDVAALNALHKVEEQVFLNDSRVAVYPDSGRWRPIG